MNILGFLYTSWDSYYQNKFKTKISKKNQEKIFQKRKTKFPTAKINSLNTQIMTFADRHTHSSIIPLSMIFQKKWKQI